MEKINFDILIIGGGAAGMTAGVYAAMENPRKTIGIIEKKERLGRKLQATGNGKCNISNEKAKGIEQSLDFFHKIGVITILQEEGRRYPCSMQSRDIVEAFEREIKKRNIHVITNVTVKEIENNDNHFIVNNRYTTEKLLITTGGKAGPQYGATGDGYKMAVSFGHSVGKLVPVLTAMEIEEPLGNKQRVKGKFTLKKKGEVVFQEAGEIQFTEYGISGVCVFNASRFLLIDESTNFYDYQGEIDFLPHLALEIIRKEIEYRKEQGLDLLATLLPADIAPHIIAKEDIAYFLKHFPLTITGARGWKQAQCTKGGVSLLEVNQETMESTKKANLYFAGEILDYDGPCGGFNLQYAWETGLKAGKDMAKDV